MLGSAHNKKQEFRIKMSARENASLELKIICATNVSHTNLTDKMDVYAVVSIIGDNYQTQTAIGWKKPMKVY